MEGAATKVLARVCLEIRLVMVQLAKRRKLEKHKLGMGRAFWGMLCHLWTPSFFTRGLPISGIPVGEKVRTRPTCRAN